MFLTKTLSCFSLAKIIKRQKPQNFNCVFLIIYICKKQKEYKSETFQKTKSIIETSAEQQNERMGSVFYCMTHPLVGMKNYSDEWSATILFRLITLQAVL